MKLINGIMVKGKIGQFFCKHKNVGWYREDGQPFLALSGYAKYKICKDCGKEIDSYFERFY